MKRFLLASIMLSTLSSAKSDYFTSKEHFRSETPAFSNAIATSLMSTSLENLRSLEYSIELDYIDFNRPVYFMRCDDPHLTKNQCPANAFGGLYVYLFDPVKGYEAYDTFWGSLDPKTRPSQKEIDARINEIISNVGYTTYLFSSGNKKWVNSNDFIQNLRIKTVTAFYYNYFSKTSNSVSGEEVYRKVLEAAQLNGMDTNRYVSRQSIFALMKSEGLPFN